MSLFYSSQSYNITKVTWYNLNSNQCVTIHEVKQILLSGTFSLWVIDYALCVVNDDLSLNRQTEQTINNILIAVEGICLVCCVVATCHVFVMHSHWNTKLRDNFWINKHTFTDYLHIDESFARNIYIQKIQQNGYLQRIIDYPENLIGQYKWKLLSDQVCVLSESNSTIWNSTILKK